MRAFQQEKNCIEQEEENRKILETTENKKLLKKYLDMQVEEKRKMQNLKN